MRGLGGSGRYHNGGGLRSGGSVYIPPYCMKSISSNPISDVNFQDIQGMENVMTVEMNVGDNHN